MKPSPLSLFLTASFLWLPHLSSAQEITPPAKEAEVETPGPEVISLPSEGLVRMEVFSLSREDARAATRKFPNQTDLYAWLGAELEKQNPIVKLERLMVLRVRAGQNSKLKETNDYPVQKESIPSEKNPSANPAPAAPAVVAAPPAVSDKPFEYTHRSTGWTAEVELTISDNEKTVDVSLFTEFVRLCGLESRIPDSGIQQPIFETSRLATMIITKFDQPTLAGTLSPPADAGVEGGNTEKVTRLLFLTVTNPR